MNTDHRCYRLRASTARPSHRSVSASPRRQDSSGVVARNDIVWADLGPPAGRRLVCVITRHAAIRALTAVTCAPITRTIRGIKSEVELGPEHGLAERCVISCDNVITVPIADIDTDPVGRLDEIARAELDRDLIRPRHRLLTRPSNPPRYGARKRTPSTAVPAETGSATQAPTTVTRHRVLHLAC